MTQPQILINQLNFLLPNGSVIFNNLTLGFSYNKIGLIGRNGIGKSSLLKLITGEILHQSGSIHVEGTLFHIPQNLEFSQEITISEFLSYNGKINALQNIKQNTCNSSNFEMLNDDWNIKTQLQKQLKIFGLTNTPYHQQLKMLSGGEITKLLLAKAFSSHTDFLLLDEPTNHLDYTSKQQLFHAVQEWHRGLIIISHDRNLLNLMDTIIEITSIGATCYGGNYDFFAKQKTLQAIATEQQFNDAKKLVQKTKNSIQTSREKHEHRKSYGRKLRKSGSIDKLSSNAKKGRSERTQKKIAYQRKAYDPTC